MLSPSLASVVTQIPTDCRPTVIQRHTQPHTCARLHFCSPSVQLRRCRKMRRTYSHNVLNLSSISWRWSQREGSARPCLACQTGPMQWSRWTPNDVVDDAEPGLRNEKNAAGWSEHEVCCRRLSRRSANQNYGQILQTVALLHGPAP